MDNSMILFFGGILLLGIRHGVDWDHVVAICDMAAADPDNKRKSMLNSIWYAIGHELVVIILGFSVIAFSWSVPGWVDKGMGPVLGLTLVGLSLYMIYTLFRRNRREVHLSRGAVIYSAVSRLMHAVSSRFKGRTSAQPEFRLNKRSSMAIGCIHGIGAETPTQLLLFTTLAGFSSIRYGFVTVIIFSLGLMVTHLLIAIFSAFFYTGIFKYQRTFRYVTVCTTLLSMSLGVSYLL